jgi:hypothetical protein
VWKYAKPQLIGLVLTDDRPSENGSQIFIRPRGQIGFYYDAIGDSSALEMVNVATNCSK